MFGRNQRTSTLQKLGFYGFLVVISLLIIYPFLFMVFSSLKESPEIFANIIAPFGKALRFDNYVTVLTSVSMGRYLLNTAFVTICVTGGQIVTSLMGGYAFARINFPGRDWIFRIYLGTIMIPFTVILIPIYKLMLLFQWVDKFQALIIPWLFTAYGTFLMRQFFLGLPKELEEAATLDGASRLRILWSIFVPLSGPAIATQFTISFLYAWNSFIWPLIVMQTKTNYVVTRGLADIQGAYNATPPIVLAAATLAILPTVAVFLLAQRYFVEGVATTGMKN
jgi:multiple sugar transport system permease protein